MSFWTTVVGKIVKGAAKVVLPVVGAVTGIGAIAGITKGIGAVAGVGGTVAKIADVSTGVVSGVKKVIDKVAVGAINLVTGTTQVEREQVREVKQATKAEADKWEQVDRLIRAGATPEQARATAGVSETTVTAYQGVAPKINNKYLMYAGLGVAALFLLPKILKARR
jgi:hypothetical protein